MGPFRLRAWLGSGAFGDVYAGVREDGTGEPVAVKVARREVTNPAGFAGRFKQEIAAIERVKSDFVPRLIDAQAEGTQVWLATELIPGRSLDKVVGTLYRPLPVAAVWRLGACIAEAVAAIHAAGIKHRDLKPENVLLASAGPWVIDFNLAHLVEEGHQDWSSRWERGHYGFSATEEADGNLRELGEPADISMLGATLVYAATGHAPRVARTREELKSAKPNLRGLPKSLRSLVDGCLASKEDRMSLDDVRRQFAAHGGGPGRAGFAEVLPADLVKLFDDYRYELAQVLGVSGPARLGWDEAQPPNLPHQRPDSVASPPLEEPGRPPAAEPVRIKAGTPASAGWTGRLPRWVRGPVDVHGDRLVAACLDGTVQVLSTANGEAPTAWDRPLNVGTALHAGPLVLDSSGVAYVGGADGCVHAIGLASAASRVVVTADAAIEGTPVTDGNRVYALSADGRVHAVGPDDGEPTVLFQMGGRPTEALSATGGTIFAADNDGLVYAIHAASGRERWLLRTGGRVLASPLLAGDWLYVCGTDGVLREIGVEDGKPRGIAEIGFPVHTSPVHDKGRLYVGASDGVVRAYDIRHRRGPDSLDLRWQRQLGHEITGLAAADGRVYVAAGYRLMELDGATAAAHEVLVTDFLIGAPPVISDGHCYVADLGGIVRCLRLS